MSGKKLAEHIAELAVGTSYKTLPAPAIAYVKTLLLDVLGSMVGTRNLESSRIARDDSRGVRRTRGGDDRRLGQKGCGTECGLCERHSMLRIRFCGRPQRIQCASEPGNHTREPGRGRTLKIRRKEACGGHRPGQRIGMPARSRFSGRHVLSGISPDKHVRDNGGELCGRQADEAESSAAHLRTGHSRQHGVGTDGLEFGGFIHQAASGGTSRLLRDHCSKNGDRKASTDRPTSMRELTACFTPIPSRTTMTASGSRRDSGHDGSLRRQASRCIPVAGIRADIWTHVLNWCKSITLIRKR